MKNEKNIWPLINDLQIKLQTENFVIDKSGVKTVELIDVDIKHLNPLQSELDFGSRKTNTDYVKRELDWYLSQSRNINDIPGKIPEIWKQIADKNGYINSNYGTLIYSDEFYNQYDNVKNELLKNPESRRAIMVYTRPSIWQDHNANGMNDFICTNYTQWFIRQNKLICIVDQRSADAIFGFLNDFAWHCFVYNQLFNELKSINNNLEVGYINYKINSLHIYERHFKFLKDMILP